MNWFEGAIQSTDRNNDNCTMNPVHVCGVVWITFSNREMRSFFQQPTPLTHTQTYIHKHTPLEVMPWFIFSTENCVIILALKSNELEFFLHEELFTCNYYNTHTDTHRTTITLFAIYCLSSILYPPIERKTDHQHTHASLPVINHLHLMIYSKIISANFFVINFIKILQISHSTTIIFYRSCFCFPLHHLNVVNFAFGWSFLHFLIWLIS